MAYKTVKEIELFSQTGGWVSGTPATNDVDLSSGGPYLVLGYRYEVVSTAGVSSTAFKIQYYDGTNVWDIVNPTDTDIFVLVAAISGATTVRKEVRLRGNAEAQAGLLVRGRLRTSFTFSGTFNTNESATITLLVERQVT